MMRQTIDVSVIIVSYNTKGLLRQCLRAVKASRGVTTEIIVVDNASKDGSSALVRQSFPQVHLIENTENRGFAAANNQGIRIAHGKYILLLNSDTEVEPKTLSRMRNFMDEEKDVAIAGCLHQGKDGRVQPSAGFAPTWWKAILWMFFLDDLPMVGSWVRAYHHRAPVFFRGEQSVDWVQGSFLFFRLHVVEKIGLLDEHIFLYGEDVEWGWRAKRAGLKARYVPIARILHHGQQSARSHAPGLYGELFAIGTMYRTFYGQLSGVLMTIPLFLGSMLRFILFGILMRRKDAFRAYGAYLTSRPIS